MVRAGRLAEARPYFGKDEQAHLGEYAALIERTKRRDLSRAEQAEALEAAAHFVIENCSTLFEISEVELQAARLSGREVSKAEYPAMTLELGDKVRFAPDVAKGERERLKTNTHRPLKHSLSLHVAADLAWRAAALLPDNDDRTAKLLNEAGSWLKLADDAAADRFYQAIERRCARTELGKEAIKRRWFVPVEQPKAED